MIILFELWDRNRTVGVNPAFVASVADAGCNPPASYIRIACKAVGVGEFDELRVQGTIQEVVDKLNG